MLRGRYRGGVGLAFTVGTSLVLAAPVAAQPTTPPGEAQRVALLTGPGSINATDIRYQVEGTDLGIMWEDEDGRILTAFGDTFGAGYPGPGAYDWAGAGGEVPAPGPIAWRSNVLARSWDREPADGLSFDMVTDRPGYAKELIPSLKIDHVEVSTIPTGGIHVDGRDYLAYMSVRHFDLPGTWTTNYSGVAYSDDHGQNWVQVPQARNFNTATFDDPFQMVAYARRDGLVYLFGTPNGRFGDAHLARVPEDEILDPGAYEYWTGPGGWQRGSRRDAAPIVPGPVGELSVRYDGALDAWTMSYLDESSGTIVLRLARTPTGPWTSEIAIASSATYPTLYGGFFHPDSDGLDIYFTMTQFDVYNVSLMRVPADTVRTALRQLPSR